MTFSALPCIVVSAASAEAGLSVGICLWFIHQQLSYYELVLISPLLPNWGSDAMLFVLQIILTHASNLHE